MLVVVIANVNSITHIAYNVQTLQAYVVENTDVYDLPVTSNYYSGLIQILGLLRSFPLFLLGERTSLG